jgi:hypothetical protein
MLPAGPYLPPNMAQTRDKEKAGVPFGDHKSADWV